MAAVLAEEEQVAGTGALQVASDRKGVVPPQRLRIGKLREGPVAQIVCDEAAGFHAKDAAPNGVYGILILLDVAGRRRRRKRHRVRPC